MTDTLAQNLTLKNIDALGRCYDILQLYPLKLSDSSKSFSAVAFTDSKFEPTPDRSAKIPQGTDYKSGSSGSYNQETLMLLSSYDFQRMFSQYFVKVLVSRHNFVQKLNRILIFK